MIKKYLSIFCFFILISFGLLNLVNAATTNYPFTTSSNYTLEDSSLSEIDDGVAKLIYQLSEYSNITNGTASLNNPSDLVIDGDYAYIASNNSDAIEIIDISDPSNPSHVSSIGNGDGGAQLDDPRALVKSGDYLYVAVNRSDDLEVIDVSDPSNPSHHTNIADSGTIYLNGPRGIDLVGNYLYVTAYADDAITIFDISTAGSPSYLGSLRQNGGGLNGAQGIKVVGDYAYITSNNDDSFQIIDVSDPSNPSSYAELTDGTDGALLDGARALEISGDYAYITSNNDDALVVVDISDPSNPTHITSIADDTTMELNAARGITIDGDYLYISSNADDGVSMFDISDPENPSHISYITDGGTLELNGASCIKKSGDYLYVCGRVDDGIQVLQVGFTDTSPYVQNTTSLDFSGGGTINSFIETLGSGHEGTTTYQVSNDDGTTWYYYNGSSRQTTTGDVSESSSASQINSNLASFNSLTGGSDLFLWKGYMTSDGLQQVEIDDIEVEVYFNNSPTDITLSSNIISEGLSIGTTVGSLTTTDADSTDTHSYSLSCTTSGADDSSFSISGSDLVSNEVFDYDVKSDYSICIRTDDGNGGTYDENFDISISPVTITITTENTWSGGFCYAFTAENVSDTDITDWIISFDLDDGTITNSRGGTFSNSGNYYEVTSSSTNTDKLSSGDTVDIGFCGSGDGGISNLSLSGYSPSSGGTLEDYSLELNGLTVEVTTSSEWSSGYCRSVNISNTGTDTISDWELSFDLDQDLSSSSSATFTQSDITYTVTPLSWNQELDSGESTTISFCTEGSNVDYQWQITSVSGIGSDTTNPTISSYYPSDSESITIGDFDLYFEYSDDTGIDSSTDNIYLYEWDGYNRSDDIASTYIDTANENITSTSATYPTNNLDIGEYKVVFNISDTSGNSTSVTFTFYIEEESNIWDFESDSPTFTTDTTYPWTRTTTNPYEGTYSLESGNAGVASSESCFEIDMTLDNDSTISFYKEVSSESNYDYLYFYIDGTEEDSWSGTDSWSQETYDISAGTYTFSWCYEKDGSVDSNDDTARIDYIEFYDQPLAISPGGISSGLQIWLKSNEGTNTTTDGGSVSSWADQSGNGYDASAGSAPTYLYNDTDNLNFYPLIDFDGTQYLENTANGAYSHSYFAVIVPDSEVNGSLTGEVPFAFDCDSGTLNTGTCGLTFAGLTLGAFTAAINDEVITHAISSSTGWRSAVTGTNTFEADKPMLIFMNENSSADGTEISEKGTTLDNYEANTYQTLSAADYRIGMSTDTNYPFEYYGKVVEIINYNSRVSDTDKNKVESYLATKYGITLDSGNQSYIASDGTTYIWSTSSAGSYTNDIFAIGRDDASELGQIKSKSINDDAIITIEADGEGDNLTSSFSDIADYEFLSIANDSGSNVWSSTDNPTGYYSLGRYWQVQETGEIGTVSLEFDLANTSFDVPDLSTGTDYYFIYDTDTDGTLADETPLVMTNTSGDIWEITSIDLDDDMIFSIATEASTNNIPTDITLSSNTIDENSTSGTTIGTLTTTDLDLTDTHTYSLVSGTGDDDNSLFSISGDSLIIQDSPDYEIKSSYSIRIQTDDGNLGQYQEEFTIYVNNLSETTNSIIDFEDVEDENKYSVTSGTRTRTTTNPGESSYSLEVTSPGNSAQSCFEISNTFSDTGTVTFMYNVSTESGSDYFYFYIDDVEQSSWSGDVSWTTYSDDTVASGEHTYKWCYVKDNNGSDGTDNVYVDYITFHTTSSDLVAPIISGYNYSDSELLPGGTHDIVVSYSDADSGVNTSSDSVSLYLWDGSSSWGSDISSSGLDLASKSVTTTSATYSTSDLASGKYMIDFQISDNDGNTSTSSSLIFYIDKPSFNISTGSIDIGTISSDNTDTFSNELTITVNTIGAAFDITMNQGTNLTYSTIEIGSWDGTNGFGYDQEVYTSTISIINTDEVIASESTSINTNGDQNTYTYNIKLGVNTQEQQAAGAYEGSLNFEVNFNY